MASEGTNFKVARAKSTLRKMTPRIPLVADVRVVLTRALARIMLGQRRLRPFLLGRRYRDLVVKGLDPHLGVVLSLEHITKHSEIWNQTPEEARAMLREGVRIAERVPSASVRTRDVELKGSEGPLRARLYEPEGLARPSGGLVYIHGGGWVTGDLDTHHTLCRRLALLGNIRVIAITYGLAPENRFPKAADDAVAAFRDVAARAGEFGIDSTRIGVGGDSAGGNLSAVVALETRGDAVRPRLQALLYPALDATCTLPSHTENGKNFYLTRESIDWYCHHYFRNEDALRKHPRVSPLHAPDVAGAAPALVVIAEFDPLRDEAIAYAKRLREAGVPVDERMAKGLIHGFALMTALSSAALEATEDMARAIGEALGPSDNRQAK